MIEHLGDLLRLSLNSQGVQEISLAEELAFLDHYLAIQSIRFGDAWKIETRIAPDVKDALVPSLFIQPLVKMRSAMAFLKELGAGQPLGVRSMSRRDS